MSAHKVNRDLRDAGLAGIQTKCYDSSGNITFDSGATVPGSVAGYATGCIFVQNDAATPGTMAYVNTGTATTASFSQIGTTAGSFSIAAPLTSTHFDATNFAAHVWIAPVACTLVSIYEVHQIAALQGTMSVKKLPAASTAAISTGTTVHSTTFNTSGGANNTIESRTGAGITTTAVAAGDRFGIVSGLLPTSYQGMFTMNFVVA